MMENGTRARFVGAIAERVNAGSVAEIHLFQPIRLGGIESCVAVVAVEERAGDERAVRSSPAESRLAVYTATYRLTLKGSERGKWEFAMTAEADAPLVTVDAVVRGVQRRSGDVDDPEKLSGDEFRELLRTSRLDSPSPDSPRP